MKEYGSRSQSLVENIEYKIKLKYSPSMRMNLIENKILFHCIYLHLLLKMGGSSLALFSGFPIARSLFLLSLWYIHVSLVDIIMGLYILVTSSQPTTVLS